MLRYVIFLLLTITLTSNAATNYKGVCGNKYYDIEIQTDEPHYKKVKFYYANCENGVLKILVYDKKKKKYIIGTIFSPGNNYGYIYYPENNSQLQHYLHKNYVKKFESFKIPGNNFIGLYALMLSMFIFGFIITFIKKERY